MSLVIKKSNDNFDSGFNVFMGKGIFMCDNGHSITVLINLTLLLSLYPSDTWFILYK